MVKDWGKKQNIRTQIPRNKMDFQKGSGPGPVRRVGRSTRWGCTAGRRRRRGRRGGGWRRRGTRRGPPVAVRKGVGSLDGDPGGGHTQPNPSRSQWEKNGWRVDGIRSICLRVAVWGEESHPRPPACPLPPGCALGLACGEATEARTETRGPTPTPFSKPVGKKMGQRLEPAPFLTRSSLDGDPGVGTGGGD